jgi:hypothetical protein
MYFTCFLKAGEATACAPLDFVNEAAKAVTLTDHFKTPEARQQHYIRLFESVDRWEFISVDEEGKTQAVMVLCVDDYDAHKGEPVLFNMTANSLKPGLLIPGYKYMYRLAQELGINWILTSRSQGDNVSLTYKKVKLPVA